MLLISCLRTVNPSNCPMCRKAFNPERIKKLHVDKAPADGTALMGAVSEENELLRRVGSLFGEDSEDEDVNALVEEVTAWLSRHTGSTVSQRFSSTPLAGWSERVSRSPTVPRPPSPHSIMPCGTPSPHCTSTRRCRPRKPLTRKLLRSCVRPTSDMLTLSKRTSTLPWPSSATCSTSRKSSGRSTKRESPNLTLFLSAHDCSQITSISRKVIICAAIGFDAAGTDHSCYSFRLIGWAGGS